MMAAPSTSTPPQSRRERLAAQRAAYLDWARTADSDEPPATLGAPPPVEE